MSHPTHSQHTQGHQAQGQHPHGQAVPEARRGAPDVSDATVGQLMGNISRDLSTLMRQELALAKAELKAEAGKAGRSAGMLGGAGFAGYMVVLFLSFALWWALANTMDQGWAALIVAVLWAIIGAALYTAGRAGLRKVDPVPQRTVDTLKHVPDALKTP